MRRARSTVVRTMCSCNQGVYHSTLGMPSVAANGRMPRPGANWRNCRSSIECLQKNEDNITKARENRAMYREAIHDLIPADQRDSLVGVLDRDLNKARSK